MTRNNASPRPYPIPISYIAMAGCRRVWRFVRGRNGRRYFVRFGTFREPLAWAFHAAESPGSLCHWKAGPSSAAFRVWHCPCKPGVCLRASGIIYGPSGRHRTGRHRRGIHPLLHRRMPRERAADPVPDQRNHHRKRRPADIARHHPEGDAGAPEDRARHGHALRPRSRAHLRP